MGLASARGPLSELLVLAPVQQGAYLVGIEQAGNTEVVRLLVASGRGGGAERRSIEDDLIEFGVGPQRGEALVRFTVLGLRPDGGVLVEWIFGFAVRLAENV